MKPADELKYFLRHPKTGKVVAGYDSLEAMRTIYGYEVVDADGKFLFQRFPNGGMIVEIDENRHSE